MAKVDSFPIERFLVERPEPAGMPERLMCMDDRPALEDMLYWQIGGGVDGMGRDIGTAREAEKPYSFINTRRPLHTQSALAAQRLRSMGTVGLMHEACAAYGLARKIQETIIEKPDKVFAVSRQIQPEMTFTRFERVHAAGRRILEHGLIVPTTDADKDLLTGLPKLGLPAVPRIKLVDEPHRAGDMVFDYAEDALWDVRAAFESGSPAYYVGLGIYQAVMRRQASEVGVSPETVQDVTTARHAAISLLLPKPEGQDNLNIHLRRAA